KLDLLNEKFYAFHVSGGTTEGLLISPNTAQNGNLFEISLLVKSLDLHAGQLIDRVGVMLSLDFPCGKPLTDLALKCNETIKIKPTLKDGNVNLSGVQNKCKFMLENKYKPEYIARYVIEYIKTSLDSMTEYIYEKNGIKPIVFAGGVMSNVIIRDFMQNKYNAFFAEPQFSTDNAAGVAIIGSILNNKK
ncbi:MAG: peptidase M22, partial [Oscillospiraceae bacterium]